MSYSLTNQKNSSIENEDLYKVVEELKKIKTPKNENKILLVLNSIGGNIYPAYKIIHILRSKCKSFEVIILENANSAATLMALGADMIYMSEQSELGPLDLPMPEHPTFEGVVGPLSALDGVKPLSYLFSSVYLMALNNLGLDIRTKTRMSRKDSLKLALDFASSYIQPMVDKLDPWILNMCERSLRIAENYGKEFLFNYMFKGNINFKSKSEDIAHKLVWGFPAHDYTISMENAKKMGLEVDHCHNTKKGEALWDYYIKNLKDKREKTITLYTEGEFLKIIDNQK